VHAADLVADHIERGDRLSEEPTGLGEHIANPIGIDVPDAAGMDIATDGQGKDHAWAAWGTTLHTIDLATGRATAVGPIPGATHPVISLAILDDLP
jgi:hypothetical protein